MRGIINVVNNDGSEIPNNFQFGISTNPYILPSVAQSSPTFPNLEDGTYYIFFRRIGTNWSINQCLIETVSCNSSPIEIITAVSKIKKQVVNAQNGHIVTIIDGAIASEIIDNYYFVCDFFETNEMGRRVYYVDYIKIDNNTIQLIMDEEVTFTGTIIIQRL